MYEDEGNEIVYYVVTSRELVFPMVYPCIPNNWFTMNGYEDNVTPRVRLYPSIEGALMAKEHIEKGDIFYVYKYDGKDTLHIPDTDAVPSSNVTLEVWSLKPISLKYVRSIRIKGFEKDMKLFGFYYRGKKVKVPIKIPKF